MEKSIRGNVLAQPNNLVWTGDDKTHQPWLFSAVPPLSREISGLTVNNRECGTCSKAQ
jgi:hypothetical protein